MTEFKIKEPTRDERGIIEATIAIENAVASGGGFVLLTFEKTEPKKEDSGFNMSAMIHGLEPYYVAQGIHATLNNRQDIAFELAKAMLEKIKKGQK